MKPKLIEKELTDIEARLKAIYEEKESLIEVTVAGCSHPVEDVRELPYFASGGKPWLICSKCGYTEEGWYCGYKKLRHAEYAEVPRISFATWIELRTIQVHQSPANAASPSAEPKNIEN
jgi:hypothetical protein